MLQVKTAIESFDIDCGKISNQIDGINTSELYFQIRRRKENIIKFREEIGFRLNQDKIERLNHCYTTLKKTLKK